MGNLAKVYRGYPIVSWIFYSVVTNALLYRDSAHNLRVHQSIGGRWSLSFLLSLFLLSPLWLGDYDT